MKEYDPAIAVQTQSLVKKISWAGSTSGVYRCRFSWGNFRTLVRMVPEKQHCLRHFAGLCASDIGYVGDFRAGG